MSPARISLLVETNSLLLITGNRSLRLWKGLGISALVPAGESDIGEFPCSFPVDQGFGLQRRVRSRLPAPPFSPRLQRLCTRYPRPSQKLPRFRGVLGEGHSRIRTGDGKFRADSGQLVAFISVAKFGGSDSLPIRPTGNTGGSNSIRSAILSVIPHNLSA